MRNASISIYKAKIFTVLKKKKKKLNSNFIFIKQIKTFLQKIFQTVPKSIFKNKKKVFFSSIGLFRPYIKIQLLQHKIFFLKKKKQKKSKFYTFRIKIYAKRLYKFITIFILINRKKRAFFGNKYIERYQVLFKKLHQYQKIAFSLRLYKTFLPRTLKRKRKKYSKVVPLRSKILRYVIKRRKKKIRGIKNIRRKSIHFFIPSHLQIDFRTLRAIKMQSPKLEDIYYSFRISLPKIYSFYRSQGF